MVEPSVGGASDYNVHKRRREALNPYFSQKTVMSLEPLLRMKVQLLCDRFNESLAAAVPINLSDAYFALSNE
jgi:cytochrome P450